MNQQFMRIAIEQLQRGKYQPRRDFNPESLEELAQSIKTQGLIEPLVLRALPTGGYEIIAGERRWRAAQIAGLRELPCLVGNYSDEQAAALTLIENIQRQALNLIEEAEAYQRLITEFLFRQEDLALLVGKSRSHIANLLRLLNLSDWVQNRLREQQLSLGHARLLVNLTASAQLALAKRAISEDWSVRRLEQEVRRQKQAQPQTRPIQADCNLLDLQKTLADHLGAPIEIQQESDQSGWLKIRFFDNDTLSGLLERMGLRYD